VYYANGFVVMKVNLSLVTYWVHTFDLQGGTRDKQSDGDSCSHSRNTHRDG